MKKWIFAATTLALAATSLGAHAASETLFYQGNSFDLLPYGPAPGKFLPGKLPVARLGEAITGDVVLTSPLLADASNFDYSAQVLAYSFSVGGHVVLSSTPGVGHPGNQQPSIDFTTVNGVITDYTVGEAYSGSKGSQSSIAVVGLSASQGDGYAATVSWINGVTEFTAGLSSTPGQWSTASIEAPEMDPNSAFSALTLLAGGMLVLRGRRSMVPRAGIEPAT